MNKTKIGWCDSTWNPVVGCLHECEYYYARGIAERFGGKQKYTNIFEEDKPIIGADSKALAYPHSFSPTLLRYRLNDYIGKKGRNIFVCSMADLFGKWVPDSWIEEVFKACEKAPQHTYLFLTKNPKRYMELETKGILRHSENMWYGWSQTDNEKGVGIILPPSINAFVSIEPLLKPFGKPKIKGIDWVIIGAETGHRKDKVVPKRKWIEDIVNECKKANIPVFMKSSLADIWGEPLIQEFPKELIKRGQQ